MKVSVRECPQTSMANSAWPQNLQTSLHSIIHSDPYKFIEIIDDMEGDIEKCMTLNVNVPPLTRKRDVEVVVTRPSVLVRGNGHAQQPAVINGELEGAIDLKAAPGYSLGLALTC